MHDYQPSKFRGELIENVLFIPKVKYTEKKISEVEIKRQFL